MVWCKAKQSSQLSSSIDVDGKQGFSLETNWPTEHKRWVDNHPFGWKFSFPMVGWLRVTSFRSRRFNCEKEIVLNIAIGFGLLNRSGSVKVSHSPRTSWFQQEEAQDRHEAHQSEHLWIFKPHQRLIATVQSPYCAYISEDTWKSHSSNKPNFIKEGF